MGRYLWRCHPRRHRAVAAWLAGSWDRPRHREYQQWHDTRREQLWHGRRLWWVVSSIIALGFGGYAAAWLAGIEIKWDGVLHGLITWGIATLLTIYLLTSAVGSVIGGGFSAVGSAASAAGSGVKDAAQPLAQATGVSPDMLQQQAQAYLQPANPDPATLSPQDAQKQVVTNLATYAKGGPDAPAAKERVVTIMAAQQHISHDDAAKRFDDAQAKLQQARDQAVQTAKNAADASAAAASKTSFAAFGDLSRGHCGSRWRFNRGPTPASGEPARHSLIVEIDRRESAVMQRNSDAYRPSSASDPGYQNVLSAGDVAMPRTFMGKPRTRRNLIGFNLTRTVNIDAACAELK